MSKLFAKSCSVSSYSMDLRDRGLQVHRQISNWLRLDPAKDWRLRQFMTVPDRIPP